MEPLLRLEHVSRVYRSGETELRALDDVSLSIWPGEFVAIMGQSGSGKSTLMNILGCLDRASGGRYEIRGQHVANLSNDALAALRRDTFGFVFQRYNLLATATAEENVEIPGIYAALPRAERAERARSLLTKLGIGERGSHRPSELSGGQQQRVAIARALMNNPPIILADEPTGALDSKSSADVMALLRQLNQEGRTIILITHDPAVAEHASRVLHIFDGRIVEENGEIIASDALASPPAAAGHAALMPEISEAAKTAFRSLNANKFRTALTLLGIVIGVASVVTMLAVGAGSKQKVLDQITSMGTNLISVRPGAPGVRPGDGNIVTLTLADAQAIAGLDDVSAVVPERSGSYTVRYGNIDARTTVQGVGASMPYVRDWPAERGNFFSERDVQSYAPVVVLGQTVVKNIFPGGDDPIGKYVLVKNIPFEVIGVLSGKGASGWGGDQDDAVFIPVTTGIVRLFGQNYISGITVRAQSIDSVPATEKAMQELLTARHRVEDFSIRNMASFIEMASTTYNTFTLLLGAVAAISLLVGGIGVMNIMLVSVTERTREIGIRMATGARMRDIMLQFNTEAAVVCTLGGVLGVLLGTGIALLLPLFSMPTVLTTMPAVLSFSCAVGTGLLFGIWPAYKAAKLDPVVALASE
jgi:macrolide transport system ATP-binding/permease protein